MEKKLSFLGMEIETAMLTFSIPFHAIIAIFCMRNVGFPTTFYTTNTHFKPPLENLGRRIDLYNKYTSTFVN